MRIAAHNLITPALELLPIVTFDTSALNHMMDESVLTGTTLAATVARRHVRFAGLSIHELIATRDADRRRELFAHCRRLHAGQSDSIHSDIELLKLLIAAHISNPSEFDWTKVSVIGNKYDDEIRNCTFVLDDDVAKEARSEQRNRIRQYRQLLSQLRPQFEAVFVAHDEAQLTTFSGTINWLKKSGGVNLPILTGKLRYDRFAGTDANEESVIEFFNICPPFRALCFASMMSQYNSLLRDTRNGEKFNAGWNDLAMSVYLPYCDQFVTYDGEQEKCLREISAITGLTTAILSYDAFQSIVLNEVEESA